jgi:two-component system sensor histidine kinase AlgZ
VLVFDACQVGVILRAVLFVVAVMAVGAMYVAPAVCSTGWPGWRW